MKKILTKTLLGATAAVLAASSANAATILVTTPLVVRFSDDSTPLDNLVGTGFAWNLDGFGGAEFTFTTNINHSASLDRIFMSAPGTTLINKGVTAGSGTPNGATRQMFDTDFGTVIGGGTTYIADTNGSNIVARSTGSTSGLLVHSSVVGFTDTAIPYSGYIAFSFAGQTGTQYGWAQIQFNDGVDGGFTILEAAYGDAGETLTVGAVPEPSTYALVFGALALGVVAIRRRRS